MSLRASGVPMTEGPSLRIVFEDAHVIVVDKPSGLASQAMRDRAVAHVVSVLEADRDYVGLHHRLDTPTSGLMVLAVARAANAGLAAAFREGRVHRGYRTVVLGDPGASGTWSAELDGRAAVTHWARQGMGAGMAVLDVQLETGRTHQIRRHAVLEGHPVIGDRRHGGAVGRAWRRLALHAGTLSFSHPITGRDLAFTSPLPEDLRPLFTRAGSAA